MTFDADSHTGMGVNRAAVAEAAGFAETGALTQIEEVDALCEALAHIAGPRFYVLNVEAKNLPRSLPRRDATYIKARFRAHLGLQPC